MAGPSWLVDSNRIATKIKSASAGHDIQRIDWKSNPTKACPNCQQIIDNSDVAHEWPGLPKGVKFDPSDQEIIWHLLAKVGDRNLHAHPFIDEFIPTVVEDDGICYTHPQNLPGVKQNGSVAHFFHRAIKAYNTGTRKRRKINADDSGDVRWHKTGRTKPVLLDGVQRGCKKIMVLYMSPVRGGKPEKTNWVMHQYHLGTEEEEKEGEYVISKVFYQQQQVKPSEKYDQDFAEGVGTMITQVDPATPKSMTPDQPRSEEKISNFAKGQESDNTSLTPFIENPDMVCMEDVETTIKRPNDQDQHADENHADHLDGYNNSQSGDDKWWEGESQYLLDSQQLVEGLSLCDELLQSQSPDRHEHGRESKGKPRLSDYAQLGPEDLKKDLEECQNLAVNPANIELDTPPDFRLSQLEFGSQESFLAWGGSSKVAE